MQLYEYHRMEFMDCKGEKAANDGKAITMIESGIHGIIKHFRIIGISEMPLLYFFLLPFFGEDMFYL